MRHDVSRGNNKMLKPARFLDPKTDVVFKKIFGQNPDLIISFLNGILPLENEHLIQSIEYLQPEQSPRIPSLKNSIADVKCIDRQGRIFIVEMQLHWTESFSKRLLFGTSKAFVEQLKKGQQYHSLYPVYGIGIVNAIFDNESAEWFHHYKTINVKDSNKVLEGLELIFLELPKFSPKTFKHRKMGVLWLRFLKEINENLTDIPKEFLHNENISKALELAQESSYSPAELEAYDKYWDAIQVEKTIQGDALRLGRKEGLKEGLKEGHKEGLKEGYREVAQNMLKTGMSYDLISRMTSLSESEIQALL